MVTDPVASFLPLSSAYLRLSRLLAIAAVQGPDLLVRTCAHTQKWYPNRPSPLLSFILACALAQQCCAAISNSRIQACCMEEGRIDHSQSSPTLSCASSDVTRTLCAIYAHGLCAQVEIKSCTPCHGHSWERVDISFTHERKEQHLFLWLYGHSHNTESQFPKHRCEASQHNQSSCGAERWGCRGLSTCRCSCTQEAQEG